MKKTSLVLVAMLIVSVCFAGTAKKCDKKMMKECCCITANAKCSSENMNAQCCRQNKKVKKDKKKMNKECLTTGNVTANINVGKEKIKGKKK